MKVIYLEWQDAVGADGWTRLERVADEKLTLIKTVGFLLREDKESLVVIHSEDVNNKQSGAWMVIPKAQIKTRKFLKI